MGILNICKRVKSINFSDANAIDKVSIALSLARLF